MPQPLVSIIIPCYNAERFVGEAIESALGQTYSPVEVVVVDDGSTDGSLEVIRGFGEAVRWESGPNRGGCAARNRGLELARGELIQFLDADDLLLPDKLQEQAGEAQKLRGMVIFADGEPVPGSPPHPHLCRMDPCDDEVAFFLRAGIPTPAPLHWKKHLAAVGGFRADLPCAQERDLHLRLACAGVRFRRLPKVLYQVRRVPGSVSSDYVRVLGQHESIVSEACRMLEERGQLTETRTAAMAALLAKDARAYLQRGHVEQADRYFKLAMTLHPKGGIPQAYSFSTRWLYHLIGPHRLERLVRYRRRLQGAA